MDPDVLLAEIRVLASRAATGATDEVEECGEELARKVEDLDTWLSGGGFLPEAWRLR